MDHSLKQPHTPPPELRSRKPIAGQSTISVCFENECLAQCTRQSHRHPQRDYVRLACQNGTGRNIHRRNYPGHSGPRDISYTNFAPVLRLHIQLTMTGDGGDVSGKPSAAWTCTCCRALTRAGIGLLTRCPATRFSDCLGGFPFSRKRPLTTHRFESFLPGNNAFSYLQTSCVS